MIERQTRDSGLEELVVSNEILREIPEGDSESIGTLLSQDGALGANRRILLGLDPQGSTRDLRIVQSNRSALAAFPAIVANPLPAIYSHAVTARRDRHKLIELISNELAQFRLIHLDAARLREPTEKISSGILAPDASNLAAVLADLPAPVLGSMKADLVSLIPGLAGFDIVADGDSLRIDFKLSGGDVLPARLASDGTLRALALLAVLTVEPHSSIIALEEPENGIYPGRLRRLVTLLRDLSVEDGKTQVLLTTHSPVVVAALRDKPELLRVVDIVVRDGKRDTRARSVGKPKQPGDSAFVASLREVDNLLHSADAEAAE